MAVFSSCGCHTLNLCGAQAAESCPEIITFFGSIEKLYKFFCSSPERWEILLRYLGCSLHKLSDTRWSARIDSVQPFALSISKIAETVKTVPDLVRTAKSRSDAIGLLKCCRSFKCIVLPFAWFKVLSAIDLSQARDVTLDDEIANLKSLLEDLEHVRKTWDAICAQCKAVAENVGINATFKSDIQQDVRRKVAERSSAFTQSPAHGPQNARFLRFD